jgi:hypothetical protein
MLIESCVVVSMQYRYCAAGIQEIPARRTLQNYICSCFRPMQEMAIAMVQRKRTVNLGIKSRN